MDWPIAFFFIHHILALAGRRRRRITPRCWTPSPIDRVRPMGWPGRAVGSRARRPCGDAAASPGAAGLAAGSTRRCSGRMPAPSCCQRSPETAGRNSIAAANSKVVRIAAASASVMTNIPKACRCTPRLASAVRCPTIETVAEPAGRNVGAIITSHLMMAARHPGCSSFLCLWPGV